MPDSRLKTLLVSGLQEMLGADRQLVKAFPRLGRAVSDKEVKKLCREGVDYTEERIARLERCLRLLGARPRVRRSAAMDGLIKEAMNAVQSGGTGEEDATVLCSVQKIAHYGSAGYWTLCAYAEALPDEKTKTILMKSLREKEDAIQEMMQMAESAFIPRLAREDRAASAQSAKPVRNGTARPRRSQAA